MNGPLWSMSWKYWGHFDIEPCRCRGGIQSHCITLSQCTITCSIIWTAWCEPCSEEDSMDGRIVLHCEVSSTETVEILRWSHSNNRNASHFSHILDPIRMLQSFRKWDKGMDINPEDEISHTTQYHEAFLKFVENEYCGKHQHVPVNTLESLPCSKLAPSAPASESCQSSSDPDDLWSDNWDYSTPKDVAETTPGWSYHAACLLTAARLYCNSPPEAPNNWGRINPNLDDYHYDPIQISSTFWLQDITDWWHQQEEMHSKYANLSNVARVIFSIISHVVGVEASFILRKMSLAAGSQKPEARSFTKNSM